jgi:hypothetical protein
MFIWESGGTKRGNRGKESGSSRERRHCSDCDASDAASSLSEPEPPSPPPSLPPDPSGWTLSPVLETLRLLVLGCALASRFHPILIPSSFEVLHGTGFVQVCSKTSLRIMHCSLAIVCLDQSLQLTQIGKGMSIKHVVQAGEYSRIDHVHWSRREFWRCHVLFRGEPGPRVRCQLLSQLNYAEMLLTS